MHTTTQTEDSGQAWEQYHLAKQAFDNHHLVDASDAIAQMARICARLPRGSYLANSIAFAVSRLLKTTAESNYRVGAGDWAQLREALCEAVPFMWLNVESQAKEGGISAKEVLCYAVRRLGLQTCDGNLLMEYMKRAVHDYPRNQWFQEAWIRGILFCGDVERAVACGWDAQKVLPGSAPVAVALAAATKEAGDLSGAIKVLEMLCDGASQPWPFAHLALLYEESGEFHKAADVLARGLAFQDMRDPGKVWRLHHDRARLLLVVGRVDDAAQEAWLAREARCRAGWGMNREQAEFLDSQGNLFSQVWALLDAMPQGAARKEAMSRYRLEREVAAKGTAHRAKVQWFDAQRNFGFVNTGNGERALLHGSVLRGQEVEAGQELLVRVAPSFDKKRNQPGLKVTGVGDPAAGEEKCSKST